MRNSTVSRCSFYAEMLLFSTRSPVKKFLPTGALDSHAARQLLDIFVMLCRELGATILMVTHDALAASYCDRIMFMKDGEIKAVLNREQENKQTFFAEILKKIEGIEEECHDISEAFIS